MAPDSRPVASRSRPEGLSPGPECAVLTSIGTVYLYRLGREDMQAWRALPATQLAADKFRVLLRRVASTSISAEGVREAGGLTEDQVDSLTDDDVERLAEVWLESTTLRWQQREAASASPALIRDSRESATKVLDRLIHAANGSRSGQWARAAQAAAATATPPSTPTNAPAPARARVPRDSWIAFGALVVVALLASAVFVQDYVVVNAVRRPQDSLVAQSRQAQAALAELNVRLSQENAQLRRRLDALEARLRQPPPQAQPPAAPPARAAKKAAPAKRKTGTYPIFPRSGTAARPTGK